MMSCGKSPSLFSIINASEYMPARKGSVKSISSDIGVPPEIVYFDRTIPNAIQGELKNGL